MCGRPPPSDPWTSEEADALLAADARHVWHPYAPSPSGATIHPVVGADGVRLRLADGRALIEGMSSW